MSTRKKIGPKAAGRAPVPQDAPAPAPPRAIPSRFLPWLPALVLLVAVLLSYQPALRGGMLWDDDRHVLTSSPFVSTEGLRRIWVEVGATQQFYPAVYTAFWLQDRLWGDDTLGYHVVNAVLHVCSALLLVLILRRLSVRGAWLAATLFALHPVFVESVAWIAELKNTLSGFFYLAAMLAYLRFDTGRRRSAYGLAAAFFVLALLSKTVTATLPLALLVIFWWRRGTLSWRRDVLPLVPFVALGISGGMTTAVLERGLGASGAEFDFTVIERFLIAGRAMWFYLGKLAWPADLIFIYPRWHVSQGVWWQYLFPAGVAALLAAAWLARKRSRAPLAALLLFGGTLFPALGFVNVYPFRFSFVADHFQYLASIPVLVLFAATVVTVATRWHIRPAVTTAAAAIALGSVLAPLTFAQSRQYVNAETLYRTILGANPSCWLARVNLGILLVGDRPEEAEANFREALRIRADLPEGRYNLGIILQRRGQLEDARREYSEAVRLLPAFAEAHNNLGYVLRETGHIADAVREGEAAVRLSPNNAEAHYGLGLNLRAAGRVAEAGAQFREALRLGLEGAQLRYDLAAVLHQANRFEEAADQYGEALRLRPAFPQAHINLGDVLQKMGRSDEALAHYEEALREKPDYADAYYYLGNALQARGRLEEAIAQYRAALRFNPRDAAVHNNLGVALQRSGRLAEAAAEYRAALAIRPDAAETRDNLARVSAARAPTP